jgi:hypothetical protein
MELDSLLVDSTLAAIEADAPLSQIEMALLSLGQFIQKADPIRRAIVREAAIRKLRAAGVSSAAAWRMLLLDTTCAARVRLDPSP